MNPDTIYYNAQLICQKNAQTDPDIPCIYTESRTDNLVGDLMALGHFLPKFGKAPKSSQKVPKNSQNLPKCS